MKVNITSIAKGVAEVDSCANVPGHSQNRPKNSGHLKILTQYIFSIKIQKKTNEKVEKGESHISFSGKKSIVGTENRANRQFCQTP